MDEHEVREQIEKLGIKGDPDHAIFINPKTGKVQEEGIFQNRDSGYVIDRQTGDVQEEGVLWNTNTGTILDPRTGKIQEKGIFQDKDSGYKVDPRTGDVQKEGLFTDTDTGIVINPRTGNVEEKGFFSNREYRPPRKPASPAAEQDTASDVQSSGITGLVLAVGAICLAIVAIAVTLVSSLMWLGAMGAGAAATYFSDAPQLSGITRRLGRAGFPIAAGLAWALVEMGIMLLGPQNRNLFSLVLCAAAIVMSGFAARWARNKMLAAQAKPGGPGMLARGIAFTSGAVLGGFLLIQLFMLVRN